MPANRMMGRVWLLAGVLLACVGCASSSSVGRKPGEDPLAPREYALPHRLVFDKALETTVELGWRVQVAQPDPGIIRGHTPTSLASWREDLNISVLDLGTGQVRVQMSSRAYQLIDWGKNSKNIERFFQHLDTRLKDVQPPAPATPPTEELQPPVPLQALEAS